MGAAVDFWKHLKLTFACFIVVVEGLPRLNNRLHCLCFCCFCTLAGRWVSKLIKKKHDSTVLSVAWHPSNVLVATTSSDFKCRVFTAQVNRTQSGRVFLGTFHNIFTRLTGPDRIIFHPSHKTLSVSVRFFFF